MITSYSLLAGATGGAAGKMGSFITPDKGVRDMTEISNIDELGINRNLKVRYDRDEIYVSFFEKNPVSMIELNFPKWFTQQHIDYPHPLKCV